MVVYATRRHWIVIGKEIAIYSAILLGTLFLATRSGGNGSVEGAAGILFLLATVWFLGAVAEWWIDEYVITNKRVIKIEGIVTRRISTIPIGKITDTSYRRTWMGRLLGYGDMVLDTPGQDKYLPMLDKLSRPDEVYQTIMSIAIGGGGVSPKPPPVRRRKPAAEGETATMPVVKP